MSSSGSFNALILDLLTNNKFQQLYQQCANKELQNGGAFHSELEFDYACLLFAAALSQEPLCGKFVWKRVPASTKKKIHHSSSTLEVATSLVFW